MKLFAGLLVVVAILLAAWIAVPMIARERAAGPWFAEDASVGDCGGVMLTMPGPSGGTPSNPNPNLTSDFWTQVSNQEVPEPWRVGRGQPGRQLVGEFRYLDLPDGARDPTRGEFRSDGIAVELESGKEVHC